MLINDNEIVYDSVIQETDINGNIIVTAEKEKLLLSFRSAYDGGRIPTDDDDMKTRTPSGHQIQLW